MANKADFKAHVSSYFPFTLTENQETCINQLISFTFLPLQKDVFILTGYAGTGKTSLIAAYVNALKKVTNKFALLAPTGRAAKVFSNKANYRAYTIHSFIYKGGDDIEPGNTMVRSNDKGVRLLLIDEASMIAENSFTESSSFQTQNVLEDLFAFAYSNGNCKIIFVGDEGQLPPVGCNFSPALNQQYLQKNNLEQRIFSFRLTEVLRQAKDSDILYNATMLRSSDNGVYPKFKLASNTDLVRVNGYDLPDELDSAISKYGIEDTIVITRSNKTANAFNQQIRNRILWYEDILVGGDYLMVVKNNYKWLPKDANIGFIANGETIKIKRVYKIEEMYGFLFAQVSAELVDYPNIDAIEFYLNLEPLTATTPNIPRERMKELWDALELDYSWEKNKKKRYKRILEDPYFCALQVKYAYAVTCHKSQGGQWSAVFLDQGYLTDELLNQDFFRWLYTGFTRATKELKLVSFNDAFFD